MQLADLVPALRLLIGLLIAFIVILALFYGRDMLIPLALAMLLGFLLDPAVSRLKRWGLPRMAAAIVVVAFALAALGGLGMYLGSQVQQLSADLPTYQSTIRDKLRGLRKSANMPSAWDGVFKTYNTLEKEISSADGATARVQKVEVQSPESRPTTKMLQWLVRIVEPVTTAGIVLLFVILILLDRDDLRDRLLRLMGGNLHVATDALDEASERIGKYLRMQFIVNVSYGIPLAAGLWFIGVPGAILWGVLGAIMRFVPYVGPMMSAVFPLALAFAVDPSWNMFLLTLGLILLLELISNNVIEPWLYGASTGLSTLSIIVAATFWTALWGPIGLILSTPLTVCLLVLGRYIPSLKFMEVLLGSEPVLGPQQRLYQRLLADDADDAISMAVESVEERLPSKPTLEDRANAISGFYDEVAIPALRIATQQHLE
ncbi:MAG: AI-2E family transporter, partial [Comamonas sp.]